MTPPPATVVEAFGADGDAEPVALAGGMAPAYRVGGVVLKRAGDPVEATFAAEVMAAVAVDEARVRVARPVAARSGGWIVDGWSAAAFVDGALLDGAQPWTTALDAADALHEALRAVPPAPFLATRAHPWAIAERVAWDEEAIELDPRIEALRDRLPPVAATPGEQQLVQGDLCGNLLFHAELAPAVIDFSPMWRPPAFTRAIYVVDALGWHGGDDALFDAIADDAATRSCLARAGTFRLVALQGLGLDLDPLLPEYTAMIDRLVGFLERRRAECSGSGRPDHLGPISTRSRRRAHMPLFMDRHEAPGASAADLAAAHAADVGVQHNHGVRYLTYWFDDTSASVFCLAEGPDKESVEAVHREAHGLLASSIIEVEPGPVDLFLGPRPAHPVGEAYVDSAVRAVLFTDICGSTELTQRLGDAAGTALVREHDVIVRTALATHDGREVKHTGDGIMASFRSVSAAVEAAAAIQSALADRNREAATPVDVRIGISAGEPVTEGDDLFGAAVQLASRLCGCSAPGAITVSVAVRELCIGKRLGFDDGRIEALKGFAEPTHVYDVRWAPH